jgi:hypothetical protein
MVTSEHSQFARYSRGNRFGYNIICIFFDICILKETGCKALKSMKSIKYSTDLIGDLNGL